LDTIPQSLSKIFTFIHDDLFWYFHRTLRTTTASSHTTTSTLYSTNVHRFEVSSDPVYVHTLMKQNPMVPILAVVTYGVLIVLGQRYFRDKTRWDWRVLMSLWNLGLSVFSGIGFLRTAPALIHIYSHYTVRQNFCFNPEHHCGGGSAGLWGQLFVLSKFPELVDTFFIVIHKKPLIFLHWYHHISVLLYCWHSYVTRAPTSLIFCTMNYAVHSIMYFYYCLMAARCKPKFFHPIYITIAQIY
jgi:elongation of very long chain fatty acids protein 6